MRNFLVAIAVLMFVACHQSGTWVDDPDNFKRAWGERPPRDVKVVHSWYWRSPHFTREEIYYFQLRGPAGYAEAFAEANQLKPAMPSAFGAFSFVNPRPNWFAPKDASAYQIWSTGSESPSGFVLLDRSTGDIFIHVAQV